MNTHLAAPIYGTPQVTKALGNTGLRAQFACPHCKGHTTIKTSLTMSVTLREFYYQCRDAECSYSFIVNAEAVRSLSPSGKPDPAVNIPRSPHAAALQRARTERTAHSA
jgi:hypothetical protein